MRMDAVEHDLFGSNINTICSTMSLNYTATSLRDGKNMKNYSENRCEWLYEPENAIFWPIFRFSAPTDAKLA